MPKYIVEGNINFYDELYKSLDIEDQDENKLCNISGYLLDETCIELECGHKFNHIPLYKEIIKQKYTFKTYTNETLTNKNQEKLKKSMKNYYIKCPYCREIQFTILPYDEKLGVNKIYGINTLEPLLENEVKYLLNSTNYNGISFYKHNIEFKKGIGYCHSNMLYNKEIQCNNAFVCFIPTTNYSYCSTHYFKEFNKYNFNLKKEEKKMEKIKQKEEKKMEKIKQKEANQLEKIKQKEANQLEKIKQKEEKKNKLLEEKKQQKNTHTNSVVISNQIIKLYLPEDENEYCQTIIKTGINKGRQCGLKILDKSCCNRHLAKYNINNT